MNKNMISIKENSKKILNNKGSMAVYVTIALLSMLILLSGIYLTSTSVRRNQVLTAMKVKETYEKDNKNAEKIYYSLVGGPSIQAPEGWDTTKVTPVKSKDGIIVPVPKSFTASQATGENEVSNGFVIYQGTEQVNDGNVTIAQESRNQFVWVPVDEESLNEMYQVSNVNLSLSSYGESATAISVYSKLRVREADYGYVGIPGNPGTTAVREPDILIDTSTGDASTESGRGINLIKNVYGLTGDNASIMKQWAEMLVEEYNKVYESIKTYGGFYIGRYELTGTISNPTVQRNKAVLTADSSQAQNWYGLKKACNGIVSTNEVQSIMIYGNMWDETLQWLIDTGARTEAEINTNSNGWGNYNNSSGNAAISGAGNAQNSGYSDYWSANNVYDLAGNYYDWIQEAYNTNSRVQRGGGYLNAGATSSASGSYGYEPYHSDSYNSTRPAMYIK